MQGEMSAPAQQIAAMKRRLLASVAFVVSISAVLVLFSILRNGAVVQDLEPEKGSSSASSGRTEEARASTPPASPPRCDLFSGRWVYENSSDHATYSEKGCSFMSEIVACEQFGRKDFRYRNWRWQPHECDLPRFDPKAMAEKLRGKRMVFVGDSLTWNQWVSMVCLMESAIPKTHTTSFQPKGPLKFFRDTEYNISIEHHWTPMLVESNGDDPVHNQFPRIARAESIAKHARRWTDADFLVFDNYVWWKMPQMRLQWGSFNSSDSIYKDVDSVRAYELAMATWATWLELHTNTSKTKLFFMSISPTHFGAEEWGGESKQNCYGETEPITKYGYRGSETDMRFERAAEEAIEGLRSRGVMVQLLNITQLSEYRKDAHPSIYRQFWDTVPIEQRSDPTKYADCTHWCLPGVPDVWNQLLYAYIVSDLVDRD